MGGELSTAAGTLAGMDTDPFAALVEAARIAFLPAAHETRWLTRACEGAADIECETAQGPLGVDFMDYDFNDAVRLDPGAFDRAVNRAVQTLTTWKLLELAGPFVPSAHTLFARVAKALLPLTMAPAKIDAACQDAMINACAGLQVPQDDQQLEERFGLAVERAPGLFWDAVFGATDALMGSELQEVLDRWSL